jgi:hypothetical protein
MGDDCARDGQSAEGTAEALDVTRFEVYEGYLAEELHKDESPADGSKSDQDQ